MTDNPNWLAAYAQTGSDAAFRELVTRYVDLVYSTALRLVGGDAHRAEDVAQIVFANLARVARTLPADVKLGGWLHRDTCFTAATLLRGERRRQARERQAAEMNALQNAAEVDYSLVAPMLDEAINELAEPDRTAILLRFFEQNDFRAVSTALGSTEDAARMRVTRALEKLESYLKRRGITTTAASLGVVLSANAVQAAPVGLALTISTAAVLTGATLATTATLTATKALAMTALQKTLATATLAVLAGAGIYEAHQAARLREQNRTLQQQQAPLVEQIRQLQRERDDATNRLAPLTNELAKAKTNPAEVLKLRGQVNVLRQEKANLGSKSAFNKITANPESRKAMRDQQKAGLTAIYADLARRLNLPPEQTEQLNGLLADRDMDGVDLVTQTLRDKNSRSEIDQLFSTFDSTTQNQLLALLGPNGLAQYQDYTRNLVNTAAATYMAKVLTGDEAAIAQKKNQLLVAMQETTQAALATAGLPADYQRVPIMNPRNIASEEECAQSLQLLDGIYGQVAARASTFLTADELSKFQEYRTKAISASQSLLFLNRTMMAPVGQ